MSDPLGGEAELRREKDALQRVLEHVVKTSPCVIFELDAAELGTRYVSRNIERLTGRAAEEFVRDPGLWLSHVHANDRDRIVDAMRRARDAGQGELAFEYRLGRADGRYRSLHRVMRFEYDESGDAVRVLATDVDITRRKRAERALRRREREIEALMEALPLAIVTLDAVGRVGSWNRAAERIFGWTAGDLLGEAYPLVPAELEGEHDRLLREALEHGRAARGFETRRRRKDGSLVDVAIWTAPLQRPTADGGLTIGVLADITERKEAEAKIAFQAVLLDTVGQAVIATELDGRILYWNRAAETLYGWSKEEVAGRDLLEVAPALAHRNRAPEILDRLRAGGSWSGELIVRRHDGSTFPALVTSTPMFDEAGELSGIVGISTDVTEQKQLERQLRQAQRLEAIGRLAGGIAHDFNNLMMTVQGYSDLLLEARARDDPDREDLEEIRRAADRATGLTRQLLAFGRKQVLRPRVLDLNGVVDDLQKMLRRLIGEDVRLVTRAEAASGRVKADPGQLEQVILNLVVNARDAMPEGGTLTIRTTERELGPDEPAAQPGADGLARLRAGRYVVLAVEDTGVGMAPEVRERIFEPFFTTKPKGKGTGLGLATVYGIIAQSGGAVRVESEVGRGTVFEVCLPSAGEEGGEPAAGDDGEQRRSEADDGTETVLVVEDEPSLRSLTRRHLERLGYTVLDAADGAQALRRADEHDGTIDLLLTDVVMPGMDGHALATQLTRSRPATRVLYMSGFTEHETVGRGELESGEPVLRKPFPPDLLARRVRATLDSPAPDG